MPSQFFDSSGKPVSPVNSQQKGSVFGAPQPSRWDIRRREWPEAPKVAHVVLSLDVGGLERLVVELVREGLRLGQRPAVICLERPGELATQVEALGVEVHCVYKQPGMRPQVVRELAKVFGKIQPDVVHTHQVGALFYAGPAVRRMEKAKGRRQKAENATLPHPSPLTGGEGSGTPQRAFPTEATDHCPPSTTHPVVIHTEHGKHYAARRRTRWLGKWAGRYADKFCCVSRDIADEVRRLRVVPEVKIEVVPNGVDVSRFAYRRHHAPRDETDLHHAERDGYGGVIGTIGRLSEIKRQDVLIQAFARLAGGNANCKVQNANCKLDEEEGTRSGTPRSAFPTEDAAQGEGSFGNAKRKIENPKSTRPHPSPLPEGEGSGTPRSAFPTENAAPDAYRLTTALLIVGDGPEHENLAKLAGELGVADRVQFAGYQAEPERWLAQMDVFALTSRSEGMPVSILEAWAAGVPVVASAVGGVPELIVDGETGLLFPSGDEAALAACFQRVLTDCELAERLARAGRERVEREFSLSRMAETYQRLYREVYEREVAVEG